MLGVSWGADESGPQRRPNRVILAVVLLVIVFLIYLCSSWG